MHAFRFADRRFHALPERALWWDARKALLVADLHLEKASWYARRGQMLPPYDTHATLAQLVALAERTGAEEIWALGDSFHDADGPDRIGAAAREQLERLARGRSVRWIDGNHDAQAALPGERCTEAIVDGIVLRHEASPAESGYEISGHFHPKLHLATPSRAVSRPCFVRTHHRLILPAFGALTGGLDARSPVLTALLSGAADALVATASALHQFPLQRSAA